MFLELAHMLDAMQLCLSRLYTHAGCYELCLLLLICCCCLFVFCSRLLSFFVLLPVVCGLLFVFCCLLFVVSL